MSNATWTGIKILNKEDMPCASATHDEDVAAVWRVEAGGVGSYYCDACRLKIVRANARYPIVLGGDHAEFETVHANTSRHDRPDWPLPSFDARDWAAAFIKLNPTCGVPEDVMVTWFANALMRGYDERDKGSVNNHTLTIDECKSAH